MLLKLLHTHLGGWLGSEPDTRSTHYSKKHNSTLDKHKASTKHPKKWTAGQIAIPPYLRREGGGGKMGDDERDAEMADDFYRSQDMTLTLFSIPKVTKEGHKEQGI